MAKTFEESLNELETIVQQLENGVKLSRECRERLTNAERRIAMLIKDANGDFQLEEIPPDAQERKTITFDDE
jgi:exodeoxyribonuclease VII small subunit